MTKKEIVKTISEEIGLTQLKTKEIVQKTFDAIVETLVEERRIEVRNSASLKSSSGRPARHATRERATRWMCRRNSSLPSSQARRWKNESGSSNGKQPPGQPARPLRPITISGRPLTAFATRRCESPPATALPGFWPRVYWDASDRLAVE